MALTAARKVISKNWQFGEEGFVVDYLIGASAIIFEGALLIENATGFAIPAATGAGNISKFLGVARESITNPVAADATVLRVPTLVTGAIEHLVVGASAKTAIGAPVYATDDNTLTLTLATDTKAFVGTVVDVLNTTSTLCMVRLRMPGEPNAAFVIA